MEIRNMDDIYAYINLLWMEAYQATDSTKGAFRSVFAQLPFFCCVNNFINPDCQKDIEKYIYCDDTGTPPHSGGFGNIPAIWKEKHFIIKQSLAILQDMKNDQIKKKHK